VGKKVEQEEVNELPLRESSGATETVPVPSSTTGRELMIMIMVL
jgi:hypothetical protein